MPQTNNQTVTLDAEGIKSRDVSYVHYELFQQTDEQGQPTGRTRGGKITLRLKSTNDGNIDLFDWMCDPSMSKGGDIIFPNAQGGEMKRLHFEEGYIVEYAETYDANDNMPQYEQIVISAEKISVGGVTHDNSWPNDN